MLLNTTLPPFAAPVWYAASDCPLLNEPTVAAFGIKLFELLTWIAVWPGAIFAKAAANCAGVVPAVPAVNVKPFS